MTIENYVPAEKPCPQCKEPFTGMSDVPDELCDKCVDENTTIFVEGYQQAREHLPQSIRITPLTGSFVVEFTTATGAVWRTQPQTGYYEIDLRD